MAARSKPDTPEKPPSVLIRTLDVIVVATIRFFIAMATIKLRDPGESLTNLFRLDGEQQTRLRGWKALLDWPPGRRVGCATGVLIGLAIGGGIFWWWI